jgi:hypothetical protein
MGRRELRVFERNYITIAGQVKVQRPRSLKKAAAKPRWKIAETQA